MTDFICQFINFAFVAVFAEFGLFHVITHLNDLLAHILRSDIGEEFLQGFSMVDFDIVLRHLIFCSSQLTLEVHVDDFKLRLLVSQLVELLKPIVGLLLGDVYSLGVTEKLLVDFKLVVEILEGSLMIRDLLLVDRALSLLNHHFSTQALDLTQYCLVLLVYSCLLPS